MKLPIARNTDILVQEVGNELLVYDLAINKAYCLNQMSMRIWHLCDGKNSVEQISRRLSRILNQPITEDLVWLALDQLREDNLLENNASFEISFNGLSRRQMMKKVGLATMAALPLVIGISAPKAVQAASNLCAGKVCNDNNFCTTDSCDPGTGNCVFTPIVCNDFDLCTIDNCNPAFGCFYLAKTCPTGTTCNPTNGNCV